MPHLIEPAPTGRATCRGCGQRIAVGDLRFGERIANAYGEDGGETSIWFHLWCGAYRRPEPFLDALATADLVIDDRAALEHEAATGITHERASRVGAAGRASSGRATCRSCRTPIAKGDWRLTLLFFEE